MMKKVLVLLIFSFVVFSSCNKRKELPEQSSEQPVFFLDYSKDGQAQRIEAGNNDYFMSTDWTQDSSGYYVLKGSLAQAKNTLDKNYAVAILLNDAIPSAQNSQIKVDSILKPGFHLLNNKFISGTTQKISFKPEKDLDAASTYVWELNDGQGDRRTISSYSCTEELSVGNTYSVSLKYDDGVGNCNTQHTNVFKVGSKLQTHITAVRDNSSSELWYTFNYTIPYPGTFRATWTFIDGSTSVMTSPKKLFSPGTSIVGLMLVDQNTQETCMSYYQLNATTASVCDANYSASFSEIVNTNIYATATVLFTDKDGTVYSSRNTVQPNSSYFEIVSVSDYKTDANANKTKSLNLKFNCVLENGGKQIVLSNASGVMAVGIKP